MTTATIFKQQKKYGSYGGCENGYGLYSRGEIRLGTSDLDRMAEDDDQDRDQSRSSSSSSSTEGDPDLEIVINKREVEGEEGSRNNDGDERWLRLGLNDDGDDDDDDDDDDRIDKINAPMSRRSAGELVELDLLPIITHREHVNNTTNNNHNHHNYHNYNSSSSSSSYRSCSSTVHHHHHQQQLSIGHMMMSRSGSTNFPITLNLPPSSSPWNNNNNNNMCYSSVELPFQFQFQYSASPSPSPSLDVRVIDVPSSRRTGSGVWFVLQASSNQGREPFLPQIPKSYLRIKDGRMTVGLVIKYLVNKLKLNSESEIELTCRGLQLLPFFTLLHVRDSIWKASRDALTLLSDSSTTDHLMILCYGRSAG